MNRAYSVFEVKAFDEDARSFEGIATTPTPDRMQDVIDSRGGIFALPLAFLYQHDAAQPIGHITEARVADDEIRVRGTVAHADAPASLKERLDVAWAEMKLGLVRGLSLGFRPKKWEPIKGTDGGLHFLSWEWLELSLVTVPANAEATILTVKQFDLRTRAATGQIARKGVTLLTTSAGASAPIAAHRGAVKLLQR